MGRSQPDGDFELVDGQVVAMVQERALHNLAKIAVARALQDAVGAAGLRCTVYTDGMTVQISEHTARGPDAIVQCDEAVDLDSPIVRNPLIVVEVVSPKSERRDTDAKLVEYFSVSSIMHYLIVFPHKHVVVHHQRGAQDRIETTLVRSGQIDLRPPGMVVLIDAVLGVGFDQPAQP